MGGVAFRCNERGDTPEPFRSPGNGWYCFISPGIPAGNEVELTVRSYYGDGRGAAESLLGRLYLGDGSGLYQMMLKSIDFFSIVLLCATVAGILYLLEGILQGAYADGLRISIFGLYCVTGGLWCITDTLYPYLTLLITPSWLASVLNMLGLLLFPIALAVMMRYYMRGAWTRRAMSLVVLAESVTAVLCLTRQFTGNADMLEQQFELSAVALAALGVAVLCTAVDLRRYRDNYLMLLLLTVLPVFITVAADCINVFFPFMPRRTLMRYSFSISVLLLMLQLVSYARMEIARAEKLRRIEQELADSRISVMLSQVQPHFLYNALTGIRQLCNTDPRRASDALGHFAYYLRGNMDSLSDTQLIPFEKEMEHVRDYLYLEEMRFGDRLHVRMELEFLDFWMPPLTLQPIVENAVRHGITKKKSGGTLTIRTERAQTSVIVTVHDDGIGFELSTLLTDGRSHVGIAGSAPSAAAPWRSAAHRVWVRWLSLRCRCPVNEKVAAAIGLRQPLKKQKSHTAHPVWGLPCITRFIGRC